MVQTVFRVGTRLRNGDSSSDISLLVRASVVYSSARFVRLEFSFDEDYKIDHHTRTEVQKQVSLDINYEERSDWYYRLLLFSRYAKAVQVDLRR